MVGNQQGCNKGIQNDGNDNHRCHNGSLGLTETDPGILEVANGLILKLLVAEALTFVDEGKLILGNMI
jgi:hypothetical protein